MLSLYNKNSPPPDQVRKHQSIFSKDNLRPIAMSLLTEDEQRLMSQGYNSSVVLRAAVRGSALPLRGRGGGTADRGRGRGRGRGEGYITRSQENGDQPYGRSAQDGWEQVGRKFERSFSRGYDEPSSGKREYSRSSSDNWRDKRQEEEDEEGSWRISRENPRWGPSRTNWREPQRDFMGYDDRRALVKSRDNEIEHRDPRRITESYENDEVPEWVEDDVEGDPGTFDSSGVFLSTKMGVRSSESQHKLRAHADQDGQVKKKEEGRKEEGKHPKPSRSPSLKSGEQEKQTSETLSVRRKSQNGPEKETFPASSASVNYSSPASANSRPDSSDTNALCSTILYNEKGAGDSGFAFPDGKDVNGMCAPPGQYNKTEIHPQGLSSSSSSATAPSENAQKASTSPESTNPATVMKSAGSESFLHMEKSLQNLLAEMTSGSENKFGKEIDISKGALPLTHENANKWFYRDPQGEIQGPFRGEDMAQWFSAGYFTMSLTVKRGCDDSFSQLGELIKRYGRVPFLPGAPLPPLITSNSSPEEIGHVSTAIPPLSMPSLVHPIMPNLPISLVAPAMPSLPDPLVLQQMLLQQEYLKQTFLMRQMQMQTLGKLQEQESFKVLSMEQQQHLSMQMMIQANPIFMQQLQQLQHQMLIQQQQQQQQHQQHHPPPQQAELPPQVPPVSSDAFTRAMSHPSSVMTTLAPSSLPSTPAPSHPGVGEDSSMWTAKQHVQNSAWPQPQPNSLWDIDENSPAMTPAFAAQLEKKKIELEELRLKEEERMRQEEIECKAEDLRRQQSELELEREQVRREKEELERQKQLDLQKLEEVRRQEEERLLQGIEREKQELMKKEKHRQEEEKKQQEEERKKEKEIKKQEEKRRKEEEKRKQEEQRRQEEQRKQEEQLKLQQLEREKEELQRQMELQHLKEEEERMEEGKEKERLDAQKKQQLEIQRQQESLRRLQQQQKEQLANMQLPATSNWAKQSNQAGPGQSKSLTEIQEEEARKEREKEIEQQAQMHRMQEQATVVQQQNQQKSWATHASHGIANRGLSLLDIQQQEQENAKKKEKEKSHHSQQAKVPYSGNGTWTGNNSIWGMQSVWDQCATSSTAGFWDQVVAPVSKKSQAVKESGEFPALKNPSQQQAKKNAKPTKKAAVTRQKKEEDSVQKLFQIQQQDGFTQWVTERLSKFSAKIDVPTFVSFIVEVDSPDDVQDYVKTYLGDSKESKDFAWQFVEKRSQMRNKARLEKQLEEDSIWGPAPAINPRNQISGGTIINSGGGGGGGSGDISGQLKSKSKKKKQKMQKLDGSALGFTVHADSNRKNAAGEFESIQ